MVKFETKYKGDVDVSIIDKFIQMNIEIIILKELFPEKISAIRLIV